MILMINALPIMAKTDPRLFQASINSLLAQNPGSEDWRRAIRRRVMMIQREETARLRGDRILLAERRDAWGATKQADGSWRMRDGRSMDEFMDRGREGRRSILRAATLLHGLVSIEIPKSHMAGKAWARELRRTAKWLNGDHPALVEARESGRTWHLAVRRTKRLRIRGAFDAATQTIVVDPRHPETLRHELAHWVLRHDGNSTAGKAETDVEALLLESLDIRTLQMEQKTL